AAVNGSYSKSCSNGKCIECNNGDCREYDVAVVALDALSIAAALRVTSIYCRALSMGCKGAVSVVADRASVAVAVGGMVVLLFDRTLSVRVVLAVSVAADRAAVVVAVSVRDVVVLLRASLAVSGHFGVANSVDASRASLGNSIVLAGLRRTVL
ncbi:hypothetical protein PFISCL1PPCAC_4910, partial [Pristionchus fissidentatus]